MEARSPNRPVGFDLQKQAWHVRRTIEFFQNRYLYENGLPPLPCSTHGRKVALVSTLSGEFVRPPVIEDEVNDKVRPHSVNFLSTILSSNLHFPAKSKFCAFLESLIGIIHRFKRKMVNLATGEGPLVLMKFLSYFDLGRKGSPMQ